MNLNAMFAMFKRNVRNVRQKQIPCGNDNKKSEDNNKSKNS